MKLLAMGTESATKMARAIVLKDSQTLMLANVQKYAQRIVLEMVCASKVGVRALVHGLVLLVIVNKVAVVGEARNRE